MEPREVAQRYYDVVNTSDTTQIAQILTDDCKLEAPGVTLQGPEQIMGWMGAFFAAFPDIHHTHGEVTVDGNNVSTVLHITGTQTQPFVSPDGAIPATGKAVAFDAANTMSVRGDLVESLRTEFDQADLMRQLGVG